MKSLMPVGGGGLNEWADYIDQMSEKKGWNLDWKLAEQGMNLHTEISEAWEEIRNNHAPSEVYVKDGKPEGFPVELADLVIRALHMFKRIGVAPEAVIGMKVAFNATREFRHGGKSC